MTTFPIPLTNLTPGQHNFGPASVPVGTTSITVKFNRNVGASPLDQAPVTTTLKFTAEISLDGGATWQEMCSAGTEGGIVLDEKGVEFTASSVSCSVFDDLGSGRQVRSTVTVNGQTISISGSITLS